MHTAFAKIDAEAKASVEAMLATGEPSYRNGVLRQASHKWRTTSAWQKAIRQGHAETAGTMVAALYKLEPWYVWYRLPIIALEDVGFGNLDAVRDLFWFLANKEWAKAKNIDGLRMALTFTRRFAEGAKSRSLCDLISQVEADPKLDKARQTADLLAPETLWAQFEQPFLTPTQEVIVTQRLLGVFAKVKLKNEAKRAQLLKIAEIRGYDPLTAYLFLQAGKGAQDGMHMCLGAIERMVAVGDPVVRSGQRDARQTEIVAHPTYLGVVPACAYDQHCWEGKKCVAHFRKACKPLAELLDKTGASDKAKTQMAGDLIFYAEGGLLRPELQFAGSDKLWYDSMVGWMARNGMTDPTDVMHGIGHVLGHYELLNKIRAKLIPDK